MSITVSSAAETRKLTTKAKVKTDLGIPTLTTTYDTEIDTKIDQASAAIVSYCNREFAKETVVEKLEGRGTYKLIVSRTPIVSITGITYTATDVAADVPATEYEVYDDKAGLIINLCDGWLETARRYTGVGNLAVGTSRRKSYAVTYIAGYILPSFSTGTPDLPLDIEMACLELVKTLWQSRNRDETIQSESTAGVYTVTYRDTNSGDGILRMPPRVAQLLAPWRRREL